MNPLQEAVLATLAIKYPQPMSDVDLWSHCADPDLGGSATLVVCACLELEQLGLIAPEHATDGYASRWVLTEKGHALISRIAEEETPSC